MTTTREAALEAALKRAQAYIQRGEFDRIGPIVREIDAALSTPATEPRGSADSIWCRDLDGTGSLHMCSKGDPGALEFVPRDAARPAPQPAADTRVVTVAQLERWSWEVPTDVSRDEIRAIIGTATPAPSDKIAEAARVLLDAMPPFDMSWGRMTEQQRQLWKANVPSLRELAGKGE